MSEGQGPPANIQAEKKAEKLRGKLAQEALAFVPVSFPSSGGMAVPGPTLARFPLPFCVARQDM